ncbi:MAG: hypothetical protein Q9206_005041 [Seirophora lacunosa]
MIARVLGFTLPKLKRKVKPDDSSTSKPGVEPGLPGQAPDPHSTPPRIMGDDTAGLLVASMSIRAPSTDTKTTHTNTASSESKIRGGDSVAYGAYLGNHGGIFIGEFRFSGNDTNPPDKRLRPSDLIFQQGKESTDDSTSIRALLGWDIKSRSTLETMQKAQRDT